MNVFDQRDRFLAPNVKGRHGSWKQHGVANRQYRQFVRKFDFVLGGSRLFLFAHLATLALIAQFGTVQPFALVNLPARLSLIAP